MDRLSRVRQQINEEKVQSPNLIRSLMPEPVALDWRDVVTNPDAAPTIPGSSVVKIEPTATTPSRGWWWVGGLPDASSLPYGEVGITMPTPDILASGTGKLVTVWPALCRVNGSPSVGDKLGTINGSFLLQTGKTGFTVVAVNAGGVWVVPEGGGGGGVGVQGPQGDHGLNGNNGVQGSVGPQGDQGDEGIPGEVGPQGDQGDPGGPQGFQGIQGVQGPQGWQGEEGHKGDKGEDGYQGPQGSQGIQGVQGWQGLGSQGWQGAAGAGGSYTHPYLVRAYHSDSPTVSAGNYADVACGLESVDLHGDWNTTYSKFTCPETGWYQCAFTQELYAVGTDFGGTTTLSWAKNGEVGSGTAGGLWRAPPSNDKIKRLTATMTDLVYMETGDYITLRVHNGGDGDLYLMGSTSPTPNFIYIAGLI